MVKKLDDVLNDLPPKRRAKVKTRAAELATLRDLRLAASQTQEDMAQALAEGWDRPADAREVVDLGEVPDDHDVDHTADHYEV